MGRLGLDVESQLLGASQDLNPALLFGINQFSNGEPTSIVNSSEYLRRHLHPRLNITPTCVKIDKQSRHTCLKLYTLTCNHSQAVDNTDPPELVYHLKRQTKQQLEY